MGAVKHAKTSGKVDGADTSLVLPSDWNADHTVSWGVAGDYQMDGAAAAGSTAKVADAGHVHPASPNDADMVIAMQVFGG